MNNLEKKKIFLSHAYSDRKIADRIIEKILISIFNLDKTDLFYTSKRETGIRSSVNWRNRIKKNIQDCEIFIALITTNYKKSEMCIAELGAAWVQDKKVYTLILPPIEYENFSVIFSENQADMLINKEDFKAFVESLKIDLIQLFDIDINSKIDADEEILKFIKSVKTFLKRNPELFKNNQGISKPENTSKIEGNKSESTSNQYFGIKENEKEQILEQSRSEWPDDFSMQEYYIKEQTDAILEIRNLLKINRKNNDKLKIIEKATKEWPKDYTMQLYKIKEEFSAFDRLFD